MTAKKPLCSSAFLMIMEPGRRRNCKTVYPGSIPGVASNKIKHVETKRSGVSESGDPPVTHAADAGECSNTRSKYPCLHYLDVTS
jgi:hypothetical protein